jgi:hypothetical protein
MGEAGTIKDLTKDHLVATWGELLVIIWREVTTLAGVKAAGGAYEEHAAQRPGGVLLLTIIEEHAALPDARVRRELSQLLASGKGRTKRSALAYEGKGFRAAAVRSVVTSLSQLIGSPYPHRVFATVDQALEFLEPAAPSRSAMLEGVRTLRQTYEARLRDTG